jgi:hypothetical protein
MVRRTVQAAFWSTVAILFLGLLAVIPAAVEARWPALVIAAALTLIVVLAHHERKHP